LIKTCTPIEGYFTAKQTNHVNHVIAGMAETSSTVSTLTVLGDVLTPVAGSIKVPATNRAFHERRAVVNRRKTGAKQILTEAAGEFQGKPSTESNKKAKLDGLNDG
jgi:hypothetical protein